MANAMSRRTLLKSATALAAAGAMGGSIAALTHRDAFAEGEQTQEGEKKIPFSCKMCMLGGCQCWTTVKNGIPQSIHGDEDFSYNQGTMCVRGKSAILNTYNPYRVTAPMKRTNPKKGMDEDPGWVEISWDEALETTAKRLKEISDEDPRQVMFWTGFALQDYGGFAKNFMSLLNISNHYEGNGPLCAIHYASQVVQSAMPSTNSDMTYCNYLVDIGRSVGPNMGTAIGNSRATVDAQERGMRHVVIDPHCSVEASMGEWVPIKPGTDLAFLLSMANVMMYEIEKYDEEFLKLKSNAPYLVGEDQNYVYSENDKPLLWDTKTNAPVEYDKGGMDVALTGEYEVNGKKCVPAFQLMRDGMKDYTPEWQEAITEIPAATVREIANDFVEAAQIGATITINGVEMPYRPAALVAERGSQNHANGSVVDLMTKVVNEMVGNLEVPGGCEGSMRTAPLMRPNADGVLEPVNECSFDNLELFQYPPQALDLHEYFPFRHSMPYVTFLTMAEPEKYGFDYRPKALVAAGGNPMLSSANNLLAAQVIADLDFMVTFAYHHDEATQLSDILLPVNSLMEYSYLKMFNFPNGDYETISWDQKSGRAYMVSREAIDTVYDTKSPEDITILLLDKMGLTPDLNEMLNASSPAFGKPLTGSNALDPNTVYTMDEIWDRELRENMNTSLDEFHKKGYEMMIDLPHDQYYNINFVPENTRFQFYFGTQKQAFDILRDNVEKSGREFPGWTMDQLAQHYAPVPQWIDYLPLYKDDEYDCMLFNWKMLTSMFRFEAADQNAWLTDYSEKTMPDYKKVCINPIKAEELGIKEGDKVVVESATDSITGTAHVTGLVQKSAIGVGGAMGRMLRGALGKNADEGIYYNRLLDATMGKFDPVMGAVENTVRVKVYKA